MCKGIIAWTVDLSNTVFGCEVETIALATVVDFCSVYEDAVRLDSYDLYVIDSVVG